MKFVASLDGRIAASSGDSRWVSGPDTLRWAHARRARLDAIVQGVSTILIDDPQLTARPEGVEAPRQPLRVVVDSDGRTPTTARVLKGRKVAPGMRLIVFPASPQAWKQALKEGLIDTFVEAGAIVSPSTCGPCLGGHMGVLGPEDVAISTTNRNFAGRMGHPKAKAYLSNVAVCAASAVTGKISHPAEVVGKD